jgi:hypothetical protein
MTSSYRTGQTIRLRDNENGRIVSIHHTRPGVELVVCIPGPGRDSTTRNIRVREDGTLGGIGR